MGIWGTHIKYNDLYKTLNAFCLHETISLTDVQYCVKNFTLSHEWESGGSFDNWVLLSRTVRRRDTVCNPPKLTWLGR